MAVVVATRPLTLDGCWSSWSEKGISNSIRTEMEHPGVVKVRRRTTGIVRRANVSVTLPAARFQDVLDWFYVNCLGGVNPTRVKTPDGKEQVWRFIDAPQIAWHESARAFTADFQIERLPEYPPYD